MLFKRADDRKGRPRGSSLLKGLADDYERRYPAHQNAIDLIPGWSTEFPHELQLKAGTSALLADARIEWVKSQYGDLSGKRVLELGPLEGGHTTMLEAAGASVEAVEGNSLAYIKCLITKEIIGLKNAKFFLGDFNSWLEAKDDRYDLIVASGVLYHMIDPLRLLTAINKRSDCAYIWTMIADDSSGLVANKVVKFNSIDVRMYRVPYGQRAPGFCGGPNDHAFWLHHDDMVRVLESFGYSVQVAHRAKNDFGEGASFFARR